MFLHVLRRKARTSFLYSTRHVIGIFPRMLYQQRLEHRSSQRPTFTQNALRFTFGKSEFRVTRNFQNFQDLLSSSFFITIGSCTYILIRLCKYVPCSTFYSFPVLFCTYSVYIYKISRYKLTSTRRDGGLFELLDCVQPIRSRVWTIEKFKTKTNDRNESWMKVGL